MSEEPKERYQILRFEDKEPPRWELYDTNYAVYDSKGILAVFYTTDLAYDVCEMLNKEAHDGTGRDIENMCDSIKAMLIDKNRKYGDSALNPCRVFSKSDALEQIRVRMDDKLSRIRNAQADDDEDAYMDLAGYLVLYLVARGKNE